MRLKGMFYKNIVRQAMLFVPEYRAVNKKIEQRMSAVDMRMLRWMSGKTTKDRVRNKYIEESIRVASFMDKMRENKLRWFGHVMRREDSGAVRTVMELSVKGRIKRGRPKKKWLNTIEEDMRTTGVNVEDVGDRGKWRFLDEGGQPQIDGVKAREMILKNTQIIFIIVPLNIYEHVIL